MDEIIVKTIEDEKEWEAFLGGCPEANFLQSWHWGEFHRALGKHTHRTGFYAGGVLKGIMLSIVEDARRARYLTVPAGPVIDWHDENVLHGLISEIKKIAKSEHCAFVRVRPQLAADEFSKNLFKKMGFVTAPIHLHAELTSQLDLTPDEDQLLARMRKATRYEIKKGLAQGITVSSSKNPDDVKKFYDLQVSTAQRQKFIPFSYAFFHEQFKVFAKADKALLYRAELNGTLLAHAFIIFYGQEAAYHYGASTEENKKHPGAYLIQWEAIKEAKRRGMKRYNFWGVTGDDQKTHRFFKLSIFKRGFGGKDVEYLHAQDLVIKRFRYLINLMVEEARKRVRRV